MKIVFSGNKKLDEDFKKKIEYKVNRLKKYNTKIKSANVRFDEIDDGKTNITYSCEINLTSKGESIETKVEATDETHALDSAINKLESQIRRTKDKKVKNRRKDNKAHFDLKIFQEQFRDIDDL